MSREIMNFIQLSNVMT